MNKNSVAITPIITPGSPKPPSLEGRPGIPSPNPNINSNNRGGTDADYVPRAPQISANDGFRMSTMSTQEKSMNKLSFSMGDAALIGLPMLGGAGIGYLTADDEDKARNAIIGGLLGGITGGGAIAGKEFLKRKASGSIDDLIQKVPELKNPVPQVAQDIEGAGLQATRTQGEVAGQLEAIDDFIAKGLRQKLFQ